MMIIQPQRYACFMQMSGLSVLWGHYFVSADKPIAQASPSRSAFSWCAAPTLSRPPHRSLQGTRLLAHGGGTAPRFAWWSLAQMQSAESAEKEAFSPSWLPELLASVLFSEMMMPTSAARL